MHRYTIEIDGRPFAVDVQDTAADRFHVVVDGQAFDVALGAAEEFPDGATPATAPRITPVAPTGARPAARAAPAPAAGAVLRAPMPGAILRVAVVAGARVERGQDIVVLEAMKMENVIRAPQAGVIAEVCVQPGQQVAHGEAIVRFEAQG
jgi:biotin carboxyl carrier protein